jgi:hypothetical protein
MYLCTDKRGLGCECERVVVTPSPSDDRGVRGAERPRRNSAPTQKVGQAPHPLHAFSEPWQQARGAYPASGQDTPSLNPSRSLNCGPPLRRPLCLVRAATNTRAALRGQRICLTAVAPG